jgi:tRNA A-37 threonylcarbamoyl transferase component Bud32
MISKLEKGINMLEITIMTKYNQENLKLSFFSEKIRNFSMRNYRKSWIGRKMILQRKKRKMKLMMTLSLGIKTPLLGRLRPKAIITIFHLLNQ